MNYKEAEIVIHEMLAGAKIEIHKTYTTGEIANVLPYTRKSLNKYCKEGTLKGIPKYAPNDNDEDKDTKSSPWLVTGKNLKAFLLSNYLKESERSKAV